MQNGITVLRSLTTYSPWESTPLGTTEAVFAGLIIDKVGTATLTMKVKTRNREDASSGTDPTNGTFVNAQNSPGVYKGLKVSGLKDEWRVEYSCSGGSDASEWVHVGLLAPVFYTRKY